MSSTTGLTTITSCSSLSFCMRCTAACERGSSSSSLPTAGDGSSSDDTSSSLSSRIGDWCPLSSASSFSRRYSVAVRSAIACAACSACSSGGASFGGVLDPSSSSCEIRRRVGCCTSAVNLLCALPVEHWGSRALGAGPLVVPLPACPFGLFLCRRLLCSSFNLCVHIALHLNWKVVSTGNPCGVQRCAGCICARIVSPGFGVVLLFVLFGVLSRSSCSLTCARCVPVFSTGRASSFLVLCPTLIGVWCGCGERFRGGLGSHVWVVQSWSVTGCSTPRFLSPTMQCITRCAHLAATGAPCMYVFSSYNENKRRGDRPGSRKDHGKGQWVYIHY